MLSKIIFISFFFFSKRTITKHSGGSWRTKGQSSTVICWAVDNTFQANHRCRTRVIRKVRLTHSDCQLPDSNLYSFAVFDAESRFLSAEDQNRELTRSIRREVAKLTEQWNHLINRSDNWKHRLDEYMTVSFAHFSIVLTSTLLWL